MIKYASTILVPIGEDCYVSCLVKAIDVLAYKNIPSEMVKRIVGGGILDTQYIDYIYEQIDEVIKTDDEELETIETIARAVAKNLVVETTNTTLARWAYGLCAVYVNYADEHGLLRGVKWEELGYWQYLVLVQLQKACVEECNKRIKK